MTIYVLWSKGANFTAVVVKWLSHCRWPPDIQNDYKRSDDWGISWLELLFSFVLFSQMYPPVKTGGQKSEAIFLNYSSKEALLLLSSTRSASKTYYTFSQAILAIRTISGTTILESCLIFRQRSVHPSVISVSLVPLRVCLADLACLILLILLRRFMSTSTD